MPQEEFSPWMKVLLNDNLFYYTVMMHTDMQELMWAGECRVVRGKTGHFLEFLAFD